MLQKELSYVVSQGFWSLFQHLGTKEGPGHLASPSKGQHTHTLFSITHSPSLWIVKNLDHAKNKQIPHRIPFPNLDLLAVWRQCYPLKDQPFANCALIQTWTKYIQIYYFTQYLCMLNRVYHCISNITLY